MAEARRSAGALRALLVALLEREGQPLTGLELTARIREQGEAASSSLVFRALADLVREGALHKLLTTRGYLPVHAPNEIYLCCTECGAVGRVADAAPFDAIARAAADRGFRVARPLVEISGRCARCALPADPDAPDHGPKRGALAKSALPNGTSRKR